MTGIPHSKPWITPADESAVLEVLRSGLLAQGTVTEKFEAAMAAWLQANDPGVATGTGAGAIQLALLALECGPGSEVITPTYTCPTVLEAIVATGATPILADAGEDWRPDPARFHACVSPRTRAAIVPHLFGIRTELTPFRTLGVPLIEDCAQFIAAHGAQSIHADVAVFSFHPTKCLTTGEGGMAVSQDARLVRHMRVLRDGAEKQTVRRLFSPLPNLSAALGLSQLARYRDFLERRHDLARRYQAALEPALPGAIASLQMAPSMHYRFPLRVKEGLDRHGPDFLQRGVHIRRPVDRLLHRWLGRPDSDFPKAIRLFNETISLPLYPALTEGEFARCQDAAVAILAHR